jgi:hypothetical protein
MRAKAAATAEREATITAAHSQLLRMIEELDREEQFHAVCYLSMALDIIQRDHGELLRSR